MGKILVKVVCDLVLSDYQARGDGKKGVRNEINGRRITSSSKRGKIYTAASDESGERGRCRSEWCDVEKKRGGRNQMETLSTCSPF